MATVVANAGGVSAIKATTMEVLTMITVIMTLAMAVMNAFQLVASLRAPFDYYFDIVFQVWDRYPYGNYNSGALIRKLNL